MSEIARPLERIITSPVIIKASYNENWPSSGPDLQFTLPALTLDDLNDDELELSEETEIKKGTDAILARAEKLLEGRYHSTKWGTATITEIIIKEDT